MIENNYEVEYIKHSLFEEYKELKEIMSKEQLIKLLTQGMITVTSARIQWVWSTGNHNGNL